MTPLIVERIGSAAELGALLTEWGRLAERVSPRLPFSEPVWNWLWWRHHSEDRLEVRHSLEVRALRRPGGELVAVAPLMLTERPGRGPARLRVLQFFGADPNVTELRSVLCLPEDRDDVYRTLIGELLRARNEWDTMRFTGVPARGPARDRLAAEGAVAYREVPDYFLNPPETWEAFKASLPRNIKESLRKCTNAPKRDGVVLTSRVATEPVALDPALDTFFDLHRGRSKAEGTITHLDVFAQKRSRKFLRAYLHSLPAGGARIYQLLHGEKVVATRIAFLLGRDLYLYFSGYDLDYAKYSVMTTCVAEIIRDAIALKVASINLSMGEDVSKTRWGPAVVMFHDLVWSSPTARGKLAARALEALERAKKEPDSRLGRALGRISRATKAAKALLGRTEGPRRPKS